MRRIEERTEVPNEAPLSPEELSNGAETSIDRLLAFIQANDGFIGYGQFHFHAYGCEYAGSVEVNETLRSKTVDMRRRGERIDDRSIVAVNPMREKKSHFIAYTDFANGIPTPDNSHGALRGTRGITMPPMPQGPVV